ncbi:MAG: energy-coupling factor transporter transmembrane protein EcfT [Oscillospiraceae bacterium]|nr:energy-coupling factor transporter transmembrane protein EcfT [Oscillospiraceae bacterium]
MGFEKCHPAVNLIYFATVIAGMITFQHPVFLLISFVCAFIYSIKRNGWKALIFNTVLLPFIAAYAFYYSSYNHFGVTVLQQNMIGNNMTLESLVYGFVLGFVVAGVLIWFSCVYSVFTTDKVVYLFGKVSPRLSLFLAIILRMVPRIKKEAKKINTAQRGIGRGANQGNLFRRLRNSIRILSMLITWTIDSLTVASESMRSRGNTLRGRKAFSIYRFDNRDRAYVIGVFASLTVILMAVMLKQTDILYDPKIIMTPITSMSYVFYIGYAVFCLMPLMLELWTEYRFKKARRSL